MNTQKYQYQSDFARKYYGEGIAEGKAEGKAEAVLTVLSTRGLPIDSEARSRILACKDEESLQRWLERAVSAKDANDLFRE